MNKTELLLIYHAVCAFIDNNDNVNPDYFELKNKLAGMIKNDTD